MFFSFTNHEKSKLQTNLFSMKQFFKKLLLDKYFPFIPNTLHFLAEFHIHLEPKTFVNNERISTIPPHLSSMLSILCVCMCCKCWLFKHCII